MNFTSLEFLCFFPIVLGLNWILPQKLRCFMLLLASYLFYMNWNPWMVLLLLGTTLVSYFIALLITKAETIFLKRVWLVIGIAIPLICLGIFKYGNFFLENAATLLSLFGITYSAPTLNLLLPVGISFYTFQTLSYVLDVYRGTLKPEKHFCYYALYVSFFPQLVAGPIERPEHLLPQLRQTPKRNITNFRCGLWLLLRGFFKKLVIADYLAGFVDVVFAAPNLANGLSVLLAAVFFALQIYCDFSGYSDIAAGSARMMGIHLMDNFSKPYFSKTIREFWHRWHISLTSWFTDYLYKPLGGSRKGQFRHYTNILIVFLVSGLWHGANWTYVVWGGIHGCYLILENIGKKILPSKETISTSGLKQVLCCGRTFVLVSLAWIFFRAKSVSDATILFQKLWTDWDSGFLSSARKAMNLLELSAMDVLQILLSISCLILIERINVDKITIPSNKVSILRAMLSFFLIFVIAFVWLMLLASNGENAFLYFQF